MPRETIEGKLIVPEGEIVAIVKPDLAQIMYRATIHTSSKRPIPLTGSEVVGSYPSHTERASSGPNIKAGNTFLGLYGSIGVIELTMPYTSDPSLVGVVHVPKEVFPLIELFRGEEGLRQFYQDFFRQTEGTGWKGGEWNIREQHSTLSMDEKGNPLFISQRGYHWKIEKVRSNVFEDGRPIEQQIADYENAVKRFIVRLDQYIHDLSPATKGQPITPEYASLRFAQLQKGEAKLITAQ